MKKHQNPKSIQSSKNARMRVSRTKSVRKHQPGRPFSPADPNLDRAIEFAEASISAALLLAERLNEVSGDAATQAVKFGLLQAKANFRAFCAATKGACRGFDRASA
jgi:hypothetical protein